MPIPRWMSKESKQLKSKLQEKRLTKSLSKTCSVRGQAGSGSLWGAKGDVRTKLNLIECKRTDKKSMVLKEEWLDKIRKEAIKDNRIPALAIEVGIRRYMIIEDIYISDFIKE